MRGRAFEKGREGGKLLSGGKWFAACQIMAKGIILKSRHDLTKNRGDIDG
jgi:hypothetical protein